MGRDAAYPEGHFGQPHAQRGRPAEGSGRPVAIAQRPASRRRSRARSRAAVVAPAKPGERSPSPAVPQMVDSESSQQPAEDKDDGASRQEAIQARPAELPVTTVTAGAEETSQAKHQPSRRSTRRSKQQDLLAEFEKIADELNKVLANLEGSTLVKRLKAASREQYQRRRPHRRPIERHLWLGRHRATRREGARAICRTRRPAAKTCRLSWTTCRLISSGAVQRFKTVLDEMREQDVIGSLRQLGDDVRGEPGLSMAQCEYWSDALDRWADDLVDPACAGNARAPSPREPAAIVSARSDADPRRRSQPARGDPRHRAGPAGDQRREHNDQPGNCKGRSSSCKSAWPC